MSDYFNGIQQNVIGTGGGGGGGGIGGSDGRIFRVIQTGQSLPSASAADATAVYFRWDEEDFWRIVYDTIAATDPSLTSQAFSNALGVLWLGREASHPDNDAELYYRNTTDDTFYYKPLGSILPSATASELAVDGELSDTRDFRGVRFSEPMGSSYAVSDRYLNAEDGYWYEFSTDTGLWTPIADFEAFGADLPGAYYLSGDRYQRIGRTNVKTLAEAQTALVGIPGFDLDADSALFHTGVTGDSNIRPPKRVYTTRAVTEDAVTTQLGTRYQGPVENLAVATDIDADDFVFDISTERFAVSQADGTFEYPADASAFNLLIDGNDYAWGGDQNFPVANEPGGWDDLETLYIALIDETFVYSAASVDLLYWDRAAEELRIITDYTEPPLRIVYEDGVVPAAVLENYRGAFVRSDFPTPDDNYFDPGSQRGDWVYNIDDQRIWYSTRVAGAFGWQRSAQDLIHVTVFPTDIALWVGGNTGSTGANVINQGAWEDAANLIEDIEDNDGEFGPNGEAFDFDKPLVYYNEELGELRAITGRETQATDFTVYADEALPSDAFGDNFRGVFPNTTSQPDDGDSGPPPDFLYRSDSQRFNYSFGSGVWVTTNQFSLFDNFFPVDNYLWVGGNVGNLANLENRGNWSNAQELIDDIEENDHEFGPNSEDFDSNKPLIYYNEDLGELRLIRSTIEERHSLPDDVIEELHFIEQEFDTALFTGNFRGFRTSGTPGSPVAGDFYYNTSTDVLWVRQGNAWVDVNTATELALVLDATSYELAPGNDDSGGILTYADGDAALAGLRSGDVVFVDGKSTIYYNEALTRFQEITFYSARLEDTITTIAATATHFGANFQGVFADTDAFPDYTTLSENDYALSLHNNRLYAVAGAGWILIAGSTSYNAAFPSTSYTWFGGNNEPGNLPHANAVAAYYNNGDGTYATSRPTVFYNEETSRMEVVTRYVAASPGTLQQIDSFSLGVAYRESNIGEASGEGESAVWIPQEGNNAEVAEYIDDNLVYDADLDYYFEDVTADVLKRVAAFIAGVPEHERPRFEEISIGGTPTESDLRSILGFSVSEQADTILDASLSGNTITFDQEDGGSFDLVLPADVRATAVTLVGSVLTISRANGADITADLSSLVSPDDFIYVTPSEVSVAANVYTLTPAVAMTAYSPGLQIAFESEVANSAGLTVNVSGLGAVQLLRADGTAIANGDVPNGRLIIITITNSGEFVTNIVKPFVLSESAVRNALGLPEAEQDGILRDLTIAANILTMTRLDGTMETLTLPMGGGGGAGVPGLGSQTTAQLDQTGTLQSGRVRLTDPDSDTSQTIRFDNTAGPFSDDFLADLETGLFVFLRGQTSDAVRAGAIDTVTVVHAGDELVDIVFTPTVNSGSFANAETVILGFQESDIASELSTDERAERAEIISFAATTAIVEGSNLQLNLHATSPISNKIGSGDQVIVSGTAGESTATILKAGIYDLDITGQMDVTGDRPIPIIDIYLDGDTVGTDEPIGAAVGSYHRSQAVDERFEGFGRVYIPNDNTVVKFILGHLLGLTTGTPNFSIDSLDLIFSRQGVKGDVGPPGAGENNVQSDWDETNATSDAFVDNKPTTISAAQSTKLAGIETGAGKRNLKHIEPSEVSVSANGNVITLDTGESLSGVASLENRYFSFKGEVANNGSVGLVVDSVTVKSLRRADGQLLSMWDIPHDELIFAVFDSENDYFLSNIKPPIVCVVRSSDVSVSGTTVSIVDLTVGGTADLLGKTFLFRMPELSGTGELSLIVGSAASEEIRRRDGTILSIEDIGTGATNRPYVSVTFTLDESRAFIADYLKESELLTETQAIDALSTVEGLITGELIVKSIRRNAPSVLQSRFSTLFRSVSTADENIADDEISWDYIPGTVGTYDFYIKDLGDIFPGTFLEIPVGRLMRFTNDAETATWQGAFVSASVFPTDSTVFVLRVALTSQFGSYSPGDGMRVEIEYHHADIIAESIRALHIASDLDADEQAAARVKLGVLDRNFRHIEPTEVSVSANGNVITLTTGESLSDVASLENRYFSFKSEDANDGSVGIIVDTVAVKSLRRADGQELAMWEIPHDELIIVVFDAESDYFLSNIKPSSVSVIPGSDVSFSAGTLSITDLTVGGTFDLLGKTFLFRTPTLTGTGNLSLIVGSAAAEELRKKDGELLSIEDIGTGSANRTYLRVTFVLDHSRAFIVDFVEIPAVLTEAEATDEDSTVERLASGQRLFESVREHAPEIVPAFVTMFRSVVLAGNRDENDEVSFSAVSGMANTFDMEVHEDSVDLSVVNANYQIILDDTDSTSKWVGYVVSTTEASGVFTIRLTTIRQIGSFNLGDNILILLQDKGLLDGTVRERHIAADLSDIEKDDLIAKLAVWLYDKKGPLVATSSVLPTTATDAPIVVTWTIDGDAPTGVVINGTESQRINLPQERPYAWCDGLIVEALVGTIVISDIKGTWGPGSASEDGEEEDFSVGALYFTDTGDDRVKVDFIYNASSEGPFIELKGDNDTIPANATVKIYLAR